MPAARCAAPVPDRDRGQLLGPAVGNQRLIDLNSSEIENFRRRIKAKLEQARVDGELQPDVDIASVVIECHVLMDGLSIQAALYPKSASKRQQIALLDAIIDRIRLAPKPAVAARPRRTRAAVKV